MEKQVPDGLPDNGQVGYFDQETGYNTVKYQTNTKQLPPVIF
jgi:hypothetical protein